MTLAYILSALCVCLSVMMLIFQNKGKMLARFITKSFASALFVTVGIVVLFSNGLTDKTSLLIILGLAFGMFGDIFLSTDCICKKEYELPLEIVGVLAFFINQALYFAYFIANCGGSFNWLLLILIIGVVVMIYLFNAFHLLELKKFLIPMLIYAAVAGSVVALAANNYLLGATLQSKLLLSGAVLFGFSDLMLGFSNYSVKKLFIFKIFCIVTYFAAQCLFALSIAFN